ncbi:MAG TPA: ABC transporter permease [Dermatophilaceae bacterium]|jgi:ABC-2 type transport system permease protein|uniref:ABC transporter permease n=1 Tax=Candidatus Phosphoribacter hodrii TaxID=2953743 RepID=A0A935CET9_9MICO|nr:ABC transporter permease [Candidatus Phosphoribacter hodrii]MBP8837853.1 ABC transporter permease [Dermatophilaceae bacterium]MBL0003365.1 ABC transporter permease [Candidatus Phosphoribacter hodrii]HOA02133.1 ABC transporter permease [Dermatophilaceae bacterium]HPK88845.1 ABC transporter permease [Dermatophilaceae bacterium]
MTTDPVAKQPTTTVPTATEPRATEPSATEPSGRHTRGALSFGAEVRRQLGRRRTLWSFVIMLALPVILIGAFALGRTSGPPGGSRLSDLAQQGSANFAIFALAAASDFLLVVLAALFAGDAVPAEASWSTLRYLLIAPVPRARLLASKWAVAIVSLGVAIVVYLGWGLLVGGLAYGWAPFTNPAGGVLGWGELLPRLAIAAAYLFVTLLQVAGIAFVLGVRTDAPLGAVGVAVLVAIVSSILGQIDSLGDLRNGLPLHYIRAWQDLLTPQVDWTAMGHGVLWSVLYTLLTVGLAFAVFRRKDVLS